VSDHAQCAIRMRIKVRAVRVYNLNSRRKRNQQYKKNLENSLRELP
jgi:hypothetical protein